MTEEKKPGIQWNVKKLRLIAESLKICAEQEGYDEDDMHLAQEIINDIDVALKDALEQMKGLDKGKQQALGEITNWKQLSGNDDWDYLHWLRQYDLEAQKALYLLSSDVKVPFSGYMRRKYDDEKAVEEEKVRRLMEDSK